MSDQIWWYVTRSSAIVAWFAAASALLVGLMTSSRLLGRRPTIPWLVDLHRYMSSLSLFFVAVHMISLWLDGFVDFGPVDLLIPWQAGVPGLSSTGIALGVIATWILVAVHVTSLVRDRMPSALWRALHLTSYLVVGLGAVHAFQVGSDMQNPLGLGLGISLLTAIAMATVLRVVRLAQARSSANRSMAGPGRSREATGPQPVVAPAAALPSAQPPAGLSPARVRPGPSHRILGQDSPPSPALHPEQQQPPRPRGPMEHPPPFEGRPDRRSDWMQAEDDRWTG